MTSLSDWLGSEHDLGARLELIDNLCRALNGFHERSPGVRPALDPTRVEVTPDLGVSLTAADPNEDGFQVPEYRAPEIVAGLRYTPSAGTYSAALLCYELLAGRHPFVMDTPLGPVEAAPNVPPAPLAELRPELPRDLAEAVMPCLERDPEWRPKDLSYLAEMLRKARAAVPAAARRRTPPKAPPKPVVKPPAPGELEPPARVAAPAAEALAAPRRASGSATNRVPLFAAAGAGLLLVLGGLWFVTRPSRPEVAVSSAPRPPAASAPPDTLATPPSAAPAAQAAPPSATPSAAPSAAASLATPLPEQARATPAPVAASPTPPAAVALARESSPPVEAPQRESPPSPPPVTSAPAPVTTATASGPIGISAIVPSRLRRGPTVLVDVRGSGLRAGLEARILFKGREPAPGVQVVNQRFVNGGLLVVMLRIDAQARDGSYTLTLSDAGGVSNARAFELGR